METNSTQTLDQTIRDIAESRGKLDAIEERWKIERAHNRELTVRLVVQHQLSIARAVELTGHHRNTVSLWVQIHNAEEKVRRSVAK
jgi:hypothetical protein